MAMIMTRAGHRFVAMVVESIVQLIVIIFSDYRLLSQKISLHFDHFKLILAIFDLSLMVFIDYCSGNLEYFENNFGID